MWSLPKFIAPPRAHFGLSLGRTSIRGVEVDSRGTIRTATEIKLPDELFTEGILTRQEEYAAILKQFLNSAKFTTVYVAVCFSEAHAYSREFTLPQIPLEEIGEAVSWRVKDLFPFREDEIYFDWRILEKSPTEYRISVVAVPKKALDPLLEVLTKAGLKPLSFSPGASVITRFLRLTPEQERLVVEINRRGAYITLVAGQKTIFTTVVNYTSEDTSETYGVNIRQTLVEIAQYYTQKGQFHPEKIEVIVTGELAQDPLMTKYLQQLKYPVKQLNNPLKNPAFNKAYAISLTKIAPPRDPESINLLPVEVQMRYDTERNQIFYKTLSIRTLMTVTMLMFFALAAFVAVSVKRQALEQEAARLRATVEQKRTETQNLLLLNSQARDIVQLAPLRTTPLGSLLILQSIIPAGITIVQWEYDDSKLQFTLQGTAATRSELLAFKNKLEETTKFMRITLPLGSLETAENVRFTMTFIITDQSL